MTTLIVTNDFPPRQGGIETFVAEVAELLHHDVVVLTRHNADPAAGRRFDQGLAYPVARVRGPLLPEARTGRVARGLLQEYACERVVFGAAAPLGLLAPPLRQAGARRILALSHGHEVWWAQVPGARRALAQIGAGVDALGYISGFTAARIRAALRPADRGKLVHLPPPVDLAAFTPAAAPVTEPVVLAAGRHVRQKGFDVLLQAWPAVLRRRPMARLLIAGHGPATPSLQRQARGLTGVEWLGPVGHDAMPALMRNAAAFALPVRTRLGGLNPEGLGLVFLEAAAAGLPVVVGDSGGAPETVWIPEREADLPRSAPVASGTVVDPHDPAALAAAVLTYLDDPSLAREAGLAGRAHVRRHFSRAALAPKLRRVLDLPS